LSSDEILLLAVWGCEIEKDILLIPNAEPPRSQDGDIMKVYFWTSMTIAI